MTAVRIIAVPLRVLSRKNTTEYDVCCFRIGPLRGKNIFDRRPSNRDTGASYRFFLEFPARQARWWSQKIEIVCTKKRVLFPKDESFSVRTPKWPLGKPQKTESYFTNARIWNHVNIADRNKDGCMSLTGWMIWPPNLKERSERVRGVICMIIILFSLILEP